MGALQVLQETYQKAKSYVGLVDPKGCILLPIAHSTQNAQIEIVIGLKGELKSARKVEKAEAVTIIPVTENSGSRSSGIAPHPLCDKLCYVAGDYEAYCNKKKASEFYQAYMKQLEKWVQAGCHTYVRAVYDYVKKGTMIKDLVQAGVLQAADNGKLEEATKIEGIAQPDVFVRFRLQDEEILGLGEIWREQAVYEDYINYYLKQFEEVDLDYITGEYMACSDKHPFKIRNSADKSKLISANDSAGFTYRGRFTSKEEAVSVGYVSSQEAHNALRWLIERQGYKHYDMCIVTWNPEDEEVPGWLKCDTFDAAYAEQEDLPVNFSENYAEEVKKAIRGRYSCFENPTKQIVVMALDAATTGRLSITYFQQMLGSDFLNNLIYWHSSCCWRMSYKKGEIYWNKPMAPTPEDIVRAAYGVERNGFLQVKDSLMKDTLKRLTPCIIAGRGLPKDIVKAAFENACRPQNFEYYNRRKIVEIACALIRKDTQDRSIDKRGEYESMSLNRGNRNRDYLYGRLLAVAHKLEYDTFTDEEKGKRLTNAERYRTMCIKNPKKIWMDIEKKIQPYKRKLNIGMQVKYEKELFEIYDTFKDDEFSANGKLGEQVLLGYHCQLSELWNNNKSKEEKQIAGGVENE
jgi:CRISPR-associated protein Csd1